MFRLTYLISFRFCDQASMKEKAHKLHSLALFSFQCGHIVVTGHAFTPNWVALGNAAAAANAAGDCLRLWPNQDRAQRLDFSWGWSKSNISSHSSPGLLHPVRVPPYGIDHTRQQRWYLCCSSTRYTVIVGRYSSCHSLHSNGKRSLTNVIKNTFIARSTNSQPFVPLNHSRWSWF